MARLIDSVLSSRSLKVFSCFVSKWHLTFGVWQTTFSKHEMNTAWFFLKTKTNSSVHEG